MFSASRLPTYPARAGDDVNKAVTHSSFPTATSIAGAPRKFSHTWSVTVSSVSISSLNGLHWLIHDLLAQCAAQCPHACGRSCMMRPQAGSGNRSLERVRLPAHTDITHRAIQHVSSTAACVKPIHLPTSQPRGDARAQRRRRRSRHGYVLAPQVPA